MTSRVTWEDLLKEYSEDGGPGQLWRLEVERICRYRIRQKQNLMLPAELFGFVDWDSEDLAQTVITERLLARGQAQYIVDTVDNIEYARKLISNEVAYTLEDRRVPNQVDNVWLNLEPKLKEAGWRNTTSGLGGGFEGEDAQVREIARKILNLKRLRNQGQQRLSPLFSGATLMGFAETIVRDHPGASAFVIQKALRTALSRISPRVSMEAVGSTQEEFGAVAGVGALQWADNLDASEGISEHARRIIEVLGAEGSEISFLIASGATQNEIAGVLGVSRPTAIKRIAQTQELLLESLNSLELVEEENLKILGEVFITLGVGITDGVLVK
jgi:hypothetical protein